jgi:hypothetical protein
MHSLLVSPDVGEPPSDSILSVSVDGDHWRHFYKGELISVLQSQFGEKFDQKGHKGHIDTTISISDDQLRSFEAALKKVHRRWK